MNYDRLYDNIVKQQERIPEGEVVTPEKGVVHIKIGGTYTIEDVSQVCAKAICLEEMYCCDVKEGAIFYGGNRRRQIVEFDENIKTGYEKAIMPQGEFVILRASRLFIR